MKCLVRPSPMPREFKPAKSNSDKPSRNRYTIEDVQEVAKQRNGICLSTIYTNSSVKLEFQCKYGHRWPASFDHILNAGHWCTYCNDSYGEQFTREILQTVIGCPFPKGRPSWLLFTNGYQMEFDGYNPDLAIAFEYHGPQHTEEPSGARKEMLLSHIQDRDKVKADLCIDRVKLLIFKTIPDYVTQEQHIEYVLSVVHEAGIQAVCSDISEIMDRVTMPEYDEFVELKQKMREMNCECLSKNFVGMRTKIKVRCLLCGKEWDSTPRGFAEGKTCRSCKTIKRHADNREKKYADAAANGIILPPYKKPWMPKKKAK